MKTYILMFLVVYCVAEKEIWNDQTDMLLEYFGIGYKESNSTDMPIMDFTNGTVIIRGARLGDISTLRRLSDVVLETKNGDTRVSGTFGLADFKLIIPDIRINDFDFGPAIVRSKNNSAEIAYTIKDNNNLHSCRTKWENFKLGEFSDLYFKNLTTTTNITNYFNQRILLDLNHYFESPKFLSALSKIFEFCDIKRFFFPF
ncbi:uncharacterized protein [Halyomorpha halys]|uniref:uncharacterized protein n=1 Tax=Halyomorpha halys TaxID=286706 RepID=UPI0006D4F5EB|nr:uncharacterized protein LOC106682480 [Halyomorpha halys]